MSLNRCLQKKALRRKPIRDRYKKDFRYCKKHTAARRIFCRLNAVVIFLVSLLWNWIQFSACFLFETLRLLPVWIYEQFRFCPFKPLRRPADDFLIIGHRGAAAHEIENTIPAFEKALKQYGANALEIDLSMTKEGHIVVWHDWLPDSTVAVIRQMGLEPNVKYKPFVPEGGMWRKPVHQLYLDQLREHYGFSLRRGPEKKLDAQIPTFREFLEWAADKKQLRCVLLDIKLPPELLDLAALFTHNLFDALKEAAPHYTCILLSPEENVIKTMKNYVDEPLYSFDMELPFGLVLDPPAFSAVNKAIELDNAYASIGRPALQLGPWTTFRRVLEYDVRTKVKHNAENPEKPVRKLLGWTINKRREMRCMIRMGVDGILTDHPQRLSRLVTRIQKKAGRNL